MPLYDYQCAVCNETTEHYRKIEDKVIDCEHCGSPESSHRIFHGSYSVHGDIEVVTDDIDGVVRRITSRKELRRLCEAAGVVEKYGKGWV